MLLAFDTSSSAVTVALHDGATVIAAESAVDARRHGELLAVFIDKVLHSAGAGRSDLTGIAVGTGPGPYTGLRAGLVTARVLGSALGVRIDGICSLDVIAADTASVADADADADADDDAVVAASDFLVATDARRREVYWARYTAAGERADGPHVSRPAELPPACSWPAKAQCSTRSWQFTRPGPASRRPRASPVSRRRDRRRERHPARLSRSTCAGPTHANQASPSG